MSEDIATQSANLGIFF